MSRVYTSSVIPNGSQLLGFAATFGPSGMLMCHPLEWLLIAESQHSCSPPGEDLGCLARQVRPSGAYQEGGVPFPLEHLEPPDLFLPSPGPARRAHPHSHGSCLFAPGFDPFLALRALRCGAFATRFSDCVSYQVRWRMGSWPDGVRNGPKRLPQIQPQTGQCLQPLFMGRGGYLSSMNGSLQEHRHHDWPRLIGLTPGAQVPAWPLQHVPTWQVAVIKLCGPRSCEALKECVVRPESSSVAFPSAEKHAWAAFVEDPSRPDHGSCSLH